MPQLPNDHLLTPSMHQVCYHEMQTVKALKCPHETQTKANGDSKIFISS